MKAIFNFFKKEQPQPQAPKVETLTNALINELVNNHGYKFNDDFVSVTICIFDGNEIEISQLKDDGFKTVRCNFERKEGI